MDEKKPNNSEFDLESIIGEVEGLEYGRSSDEVEEIIDSVGGLYIPSDGSDEELDEILSEFGEGNAAIKAPIDIKAELTAEELMALKDGVAPKILRTDAGAESGTDTESRARSENGQKDEGEEPPKLLLNDKFDAFFGEYGDRPGEIHIDDVKKSGPEEKAGGSRPDAEPDKINDKKPVPDDRTRVLPDGGVEFENKSETEELDEYELLDRKIMEEKEEAFFGAQSKIRENVFNWENDKDLRKKSKEERLLNDGQVTLLPKDETDRKLTGYFTSVYDVRDLRINQKKLQDETRRTSENQAVNQAASFKGFLGKIFNEPEADEEPLIETAETEAPLDFDNFESPEVTEEIKNDLVLQTRQGLFRLIFAGIISVILLIFDFIVFSGRTVLPPEIDYSVSPTSFGITVAGLLAVVIVCGLGTFASGLKGLFTLKFNNDTVPSLAVLFSLAQILTVMFSEAQTSLMTFTGISALCFTSAILSKYLNLKTIGMEFETASAEGIKHVLLPMTQINRESRFGSMAGVMRTDYIKGFMDTVTAYNGTHRSNVIMVPAVVISAAVSAAVAIIRDLSLVGIMGYVAAGAALSCTFTVPLAAVLPVFLETRRLSGIRAAVLHLRAADQLSETDEILVRDTELFQEENMNITGVKIFDESKVYTTIVLAASIYHKLGGPLKAAFRKILDSRSDITDDVRELKVIDGLGVSAVVGGREVFIGVPEYIMSLGVRLYGTDLEEVYEKSGGRLVIVADSKELLGVFAISYTADKKTKNALSILEQEGCKLRVYTSDHNITPKMIMRRYKMENLEIGTFSLNQAESLETSLCDKSYVAGRIISANGFFGAVSAMVSAFRMRRAVKISDIIRIVSVVAGIVIALILAVTNSFASGGPYSALLFQLIWTGVLTVASFLKL